jgi:hypothetical protein
MFSVALAVHGPRRNNDARVPDVIRHTALWSSDFPLPANALARLSGSDRPALLPGFSLAQFGFHQLR